MQLLLPHTAPSQQELTLRIFTTSYSHRQTNQKYETYKAQVEFLRKGDNKIKATLFDIADDITYGSSKNYTLNHMMERVKIYNEETLIMKCLRYL